MLYNRRPYQHQNKPIVAGMQGRFTEEFLYYHLRSSNLQREGNVNQQAKDFRFTTNEEFWMKVIHPNERSVIGLRWVELMGFQLVDWVPRTPGLYHTWDAKYARQEAKDYVREENGILFYEPHGKSHMIRGGIGSVRFKPISIAGRDYWLCTATSDNLCHSGIPIAMPNLLMERVDYAFSRLCKITGQVRFLPEFLEAHFRHMEKLPQIYIDVDGVEQLGNERRPSVNISPIVFFTASQEMGLDSNDNVTYVTCRADSTNELNDAAEWLEWYANRYRGEIITNFDQQQPFFANAPFSLQNVMSGDINPNILRQYHIREANIICQKINEIHSEATTMTNIKVELGDGTIIHGNFIVAKTIANSFNKAQEAEIPNDLKDLLKQMAKAVGQMSEKLPQETAEQAARDLETLTAEATSKTPRQKWWKLSIEGLTKAAKDIGEIGKPVLELAAKIVAILTALPR